MEYDVVMKQLYSMGNRRNVEGMKRFGIVADNTLSIPVPKLRELAKSIGRDQGLSLRLWDSGVHEAMVLATIIADRDKTTGKQLERWVKDINSWDVCDSACSMFSWTRFALDKVGEWSSRRPEYEKRASFSLIAYIAVHRKELDDRVFVGFLPLIIRESADGRNSVKKAVNWALREIGKRNMRLNKVAIKTAMQLKKSESRSARWIGSDAYRELAGEAVQARLRSRR